MPLTSAQRKLRAQIAANIRWSKEDPAPTAARGQAGLRSRFEKEVDPDRTLPAAERARRAESARKAHMQRLALASAKARSARKPATAASTGAGAPAAWDPPAGQRGGSWWCSRPGC